MRIALDHMSVPTRDRSATAEFLSTVFGLSAREPRRNYLPVPVNEGLTLNLVEEPEGFAHNHYAFRVSGAEFEAVLARLRAAAIAYGGTDTEMDGQVYERGGLRGFYFNDPNGHGFEVLAEAAG